MLTGTVDRFNKIKGYGFIVSDVDGTEVFVHFSQIQDPGYKELKKGQRVQYVLQVGERGGFATEVTILSPVD